MSRLLALDSWLPLLPQSINRKHILLDRHAPDQVFSDDALHDVHRHRAIPHTLRVDDDDRPALAYPEAVDFRSQNGSPAMLYIRGRTLEIDAAPRRRSRRQIEFLQAYLDVTPHFATFLS